MFVVSKVVRATNEFEFGGEVAGPYICIYILKGVMNDVMGRGIVC